MQPHARHRSVKVMDESSLRYPGWRVVTACFTLTLAGFGFGFYGHSFYFAELTKREGGNAPKLASSTVSAATTTYYLLSAVLIMRGDAITQFGPRRVAIALGLVVDRLDQRRLAAFLLVAQAGALFVMLQSTAPRSVYLACAVFGFGAGNMIVLPALMVQHEFAAVAFGMMSALVLGIIQVASAFGPSLLGGLLDATSSYAAPIGVCMALELVAAAIVLLRVGSASAVAEAKRQDRHQR